MIKLYQNQWHGIPFANFIKCSSKNIATKELYDKFYYNFFEKFSSFADLDVKWVNYKLSIADKLIAEVKNKTNILSIGCGIGIVEKHLVENIKNINLTAIEPSENVSRWIRNIDRINLYDGYFPGVLNTDIVFDLAFANGVDYVFNNNEYETFLKSIINYGIKEFILISASVYKTRTVKETMKEAIKTVLSTVKLYDRDQFWGYQRTVNEQIIMLRKSGFSHTSLLHEVGNTVIIKASA